VLVATKNPLTFKSAHMLKNRYFAGAELIGELLHRGSYAVNMAVISDRYDDIELAGGEVHREIFL